jgi:hypothetical protein
MNVNFDQMMIGTDCFKIYGPWDYRPESVERSDAIYYRRCHKNCPAQNKKPFIGRKTKERRQEDGRAEERGEK